MKSIAIGLIVVLAAGAAFLYSSREPARATAIPKGADKESRVEPGLFLLDTSFVSFPGDWTSVQQSELIDVEWEGEVPASGRHRRLSENVIEVPASIVDAVLGSGTPCTVAVPDDCRIALRWTQATSAIWWKVEIGEDPSTLQSNSGDDCIVQTATQEWTEDGRPVEQIARTVWQAEERSLSATSAGPGRVRILSDGTVELTADPPSENERILAQRTEAGDVIFWVVDSTQ